MAATEAKPRTLRDLADDVLRRRRIAEAELVAEIGVHHTTFSRWMSGLMEPRPKHHEQLTRSLCVSQPVLAEAILATKHAREARSA